MVCGRGGGGHSEVLKKGFSRKGYCSAKVPGARYECGTTGRSLYTKNKGKVARKITRGRAW